MQVTVYVIVASHPCIAVDAMLRLKRITYRRVELPPLSHRGLLRLLRFPRPTVPALRIDGRRVQGSVAISHALEELRPEPRLFPADPAGRERVEDAERWGAEVLQDAARRIEVWGLSRDHSGVEVQLRASSLPLPARLGALTSGPSIWRYRHITGASDEAVRSDLAALPAMLDRVDGWIEDGVLGGEQPNAADYQLAASVRLLLTMEDLQPAIEGRPAGRLARRLFPDYLSRLRGGALSPLR